MLSDAEGDNIPTASGTTEPGSTVVVTWPDGSTTPVDADAETGEWTATAPGAQPDGAVSVVVTDAAGNSETGSAAWGSDTTPPDTSATTVTVGAIAGDGVVNAAEASGNVDVSVTITDIPEDAATTTVTVFVDGVAYEATDNGDGTWTATVPGSALAGAQSQTLTAEAIFTDAAGNPSQPVTASQGFSVDTTPPVAPTLALENDTGADSGDGITNDGTVIVIGLEDIASWQYSTDGGQSWQDGGGTSFEIEEGVYEDGAVLVVQTDAAGNSSTLGSLGPVTIDISVPAPTVALENDTGIAGDGISSDGTVIVSGLDVEANWQYSTDGGQSWQDGSGTSFDLDPGTYEDGDVIVRQTDAVGNISLNASLGPVMIASLVGMNDSADVDMGSRESEIYDPVTDESLEVIGALDTDTPTNGVAFTVGAGSTGDIMVNVSQTALIAVADAFNVELYDAEGNLVAVATTTGDNPIIGDVAGVRILGLTGDNTLVTNFTGLAPGDYTVVVRKAISALGTLLDANNDGISLQELGQGGVVLGAENQALVLDAVESSLNGEVLSLGTTVRGILEIALNTTTTIGAGDLVAIISNSLNAIGLSEHLDNVLSKVAQTLLSNTLTLIQNTSVTVALTEHTFNYGSAPVSGNVIDPNQGTTGEPGEDSVIPGAQVTQVEFSDGTIVQLVNGSATIDGAYGSLTINSDGSYSYTPNGNPVGVGQTEVFTYTISDGRASVKANLSINIDGELLVNDTAQAGIEYEYGVAAGVNMPTAIFRSWAIGIARLFTEQSNPILVGENTTQDITLNFNVGSALGIGSSITVTLQVFENNQWNTYATYGKDQLVSLLGSRGLGSVLVSDVPSGQYRVKAEINTGVGLAGSASVGVSSTVTNMNEHVVSDTFAAEGNLFDNDISGVSELPLAISADGTAFLNVVEGAPQSILGNYGSLTVRADGSYTYTPDDRATAGGMFTDTFTYRIDKDGFSQEATLTVTVNGSIQGETDQPVPAAQEYPDNFMISLADAEVVPMLAVVDGDKDQPADEHAFSAMLQEGLFLDEGDSDIILQFNDDSVAQDDFLNLSHESIKIASGLDTAALSQDPLSHLVTDPLLKEEELHSTHGI
ncbi:BapA/Bap/LapF family large adhesin [Brucellaceae bacterium D45D]